MFGLSTPEETSYATLLTPMLDDVVAGKHATIVSTGGYGGGAWVLGKDHMLVAPKPKR